MHKMQSWDKSKFAILDLRGFFTPSLSYQLISAICCPLPQSNLSSSNLTLTLCVGLTNVKNLTQLKALASLSNARAFGSNAMDKCLIHYSSSCL